MKEFVYSLVGGRSNHSPFPPLVANCVDPKPSKPGGGVTMIAVRVVNVTRYAARFQGASKIKERGHWTGLSVECHRESLNPE